MKRNAYNRMLLSFQLMWHMTVGLTVVNFVIILIHHVVFVISCREHFFICNNYKEGSNVFEIQCQQIQLVMKSTHTVHIPGWRFLPTKNNMRMKDLYNKIQSSLKNIIDKKTKAMQAGESSSEDLLGVLLESISSEQLQNGSRNVGMSLDDVIGECKIFYFSGQETTSNALVWTLILLCKHPDWQTRAREEVLRVLGSHGTPDFDNLNQLKLVTMILHEVLRLYPPGDTLTRMVDEETTLGGLTLPPGAEISLPVLLLHYEQEVWGEDAKEFNPDRFAARVSNATKNAWIINDSLAFKVWSVVHSKS